MKRLIFYFAVTFAFIWSCTESPASDAEFNVSGIILPSSVEIEVGGAVELKIVGSRGPAEDDIILLESVSGNSFECIIETVQPKFFRFRIPDNLVSGKYDLTVKRGKASKKVGQFSINIVYPQKEVAPEEGSTVYGLVQCNGNPLEDVVVSDGYEVVSTDEDGVYQLKSSKTHGYVFVSIPSGYTVQTDGALPLFHKYLNEDSQTAERIDFDLIEDPNQDAHTMVVMGDIHLANRTNDVSQFMEFVSDVNSYISANSDRKFYGLTLGDMSWDQYWVINTYDLTHYLNDISRINSIPVFNTIGNHDHEQMAAGDFNTVAVYKRVVGPTYYSFNIGKVHYVVLDDIECTNPGSGARTYRTTLVQEQIDWLKKDLSYISASTPVVVSMHSPVYSDKGVSALGNSDKLVAALGNRTVHFLTGHTHVVYNVEKDRYFEHNAGAVCATWWWTGVETPGIHISKDGTPGGYLLFEVDGTDFEWVYKSTGKSLDHQFRTYDRNMICLSAETYVPNANETRTKTFMDAASEYSTVSAANEVYINVWNYDPDWKIEVKEGKTSLEVSRVTGKDPLHLVSYSAKRLGKNKDATFLTGNTSHLFKVKASSATSTLDITVTDRFGNVYKETMTRPKNFTTEIYR